MSISGPRASIERSLPARQLPPVGQWHAQSQTVMPV